MNTLTVKISPALEQQLLEAAQHARLSKSELVRRALAAYVARPVGGAESFVSALDQAGELVGCFEGGPPDLSSNPRHLDGFGRV
ncbi:MAG: CopG family transcriptional regulator [Burkholderiaceae bacterium]